MYCSTFFLLFIAIMIYNRVYSITMEKINMYVLISHTKKIDILLLFSYTQLATKKDDAHTHKKGTLHTHAHSDAL